MHLHWPLFGSSQLPNMCQGQETNQKQRKTQNPNQNPTTHKNVFLKVLVSTSENQKQYSQAIYVYAVEHDNCQLTSCKERPGKQKKSLLTVFLSYIFLFNTNFRITAALIFFALLDTILLFNTIKEGLGNNSSCVKIIALPISIK